MEIEPVNTGYFMGIYPLAIVWDLLKLLGYQWDWHV
jgi:hypothetical protein